MKKYMPTYTTVQEVIDAIKQEEESLEKSLREDFELYEIKDIAYGRSSSMDATVSFTVYFRVKKSPKARPYEIDVNFLYFSPEGKIDALIHSLVKKLFNINQRLENKRILKQKREN